MQRPLKINITKFSLRLAEKHPTITHKLRKIFYKSITKLSYTSKSSMKAKNKHFKVSILGCVPFERTYSV